MARTNNQQQWAKKLEIKDYIGITFSTFALLISALNFYYANYKVDHKLSATIVDFDTPVIVNDDYSKDTLTVDIAYFNAGNREIIIRRPLFQLKDSIAPKNLDGDYYQIANQSSFPFVIEAGKTKVAEVKILLKDVGEPYRRIRADWQSRSGSDFKDEYHTYLRFWYFAVDSDGGPTEKFGDFEISCTFKNGSVYGIGQVSKHSDNYPFKLTKIIE